MRSRVEELIHAICIMNETIKSSSCLQMKKSELVSPFIKMPENMYTFEFDTLSLEEPFILKNIAGFIFQTFLSHVGLVVNEDHLAKYICCVCNHYNNNPFHNFQHAVNTLHTAYLLLQETNLLLKLDPTISFAMLVAAISHDIDHPGNTNSYEINSFSKYAKLYNDASVLENHHCTLTFELLEQTGVLYTFQTKFRLFRKTIIACILGTDMSKHSEFMEKAQRMSFAESTYDIEEQIQLVSILLHYADLSNAIKEVEISHEWSRRISREFYEQTLKEEQEGLPTLGFMKANDMLTICVNEISFITSISIPMWTLLSNKCPSLQKLVARCETVLHAWEEKKGKYIQENNVRVLSC